MTISSLLKRFLVIFTGIATVEAIGNGFDYLVYPAVTYWCGKKIWLSFLILFGLALVLNYLMILAYDYFKKDVFGFEEIKKIKQANHDLSIKMTWFQKRILQFDKYGSVPLFLFLSCYDPFMAVLYKRQSAQFDGFKKKDYFMLVLSTLIGCIFWSGVWSGIFSWLGFVK